MKATIFMSLRPIVSDTILLFLPVPPSNEVYLLQKYRWLILANQSNIRCRSDPRMNSHFHALMNTYDYEDALFRIGSNLTDFRDLKEMYVQFNSRNVGNPLLALNELEEHSKMKILT